MPSRMSSTRCQSLVGPPGFKNPERSNPGTLSGPWLASQDVFFFNELSWWKKSHPCWFLNHLHGVFVDHKNLLKLMVSDTKKNDSHKIWRLSCNVTGWFHTHCCCCCNYVLLPKTTSRSVTQPKKTPACKHLVVPVYGIFSITIHIVTSSDNGRKSWTSKCWLGEFSDAN